ncbi:hypothetical protein PCASD_13820 [Puccinia coronata f. sp. avenae]|uniref:Uncharacterized protein n=1 Tax=Puccinia coronata f. sp. avenae TaxID=200324 RepID=A0A2N5U5Q6_9BASI|nr:hypothetical protein PCASD_13820 [Puccinia coronata f. sp. avenae]
MEGQMTLERVFDHVLPRANLDGRQRPFNTRSRRFIVEIDSAKAPGSSLYSHKYVRLSIHAFSTDTRTGLQ